jgi:hypothetical protein
MNPRSLARRLPAALVCLLVVAAYGFFASGGTYDFPRIKWSDSRYASQAEGFTRGQLNMAHEPDPRLRDLPDPYNFQMREAAGIFYVWDASYYRDKYYLYFSPLPIFLVYLPLKWLRGAYPPDSFVALVLCVWSFLMAVAFTRRALRHAPRRYIPLPLWIALIGLGNVIPFHLVEIRMYEIAIIAGMAMTSTWAYALLRFIEEPSRKSVLWMAFWLALSIAARPNLGVLLLIAAIAIWRASPDRRAVLRLFAWALIPLGIVCLSMLAFNQVRFHQPLEFGVKYQLTYVPMRDYKVCSLCSIPEAVRLVNGMIHYLFWPPTVGSEFPFADSQVNRVDPSVTFPGGAEPIIGIAVLVPLTMLGAFFALLLVSGKRARDPGSRAGVHLVAGSWLVMAGLSACWWVVARYSLDFMTLMTAGSIVAIEAGLGFFEANDFSLRPMRITIALLATFSIVVGFCLGFMGPYYAFKRNFPEMYKTLEKPFAKTKS